MSEKVHVEEENEDAMPDEGVDLETTSWQNTVQEDHVTVIATSTSHEQEPVRMFQAAQQKQNLWKKNLKSYIATKQNKTLKARMATCRPLLT